MRSGITVLIGRTGLGTRWLALLFLTVAGDVSERPTAVGHGPPATTRIVRNLLASTNEVRAGSVHTVPLALGIVIADRVLLVLSRTGGGYQAAVSLGTAKPMVAVPRVTIGILVAMGTVQEVSHADSVAVGSGIALFVCLTGDGAKGSFLFLVAGTEEWKPGTAAAGHCILCAGRIILDHCRTADVGCTQSVDSMSLAGGKGSTKGRCEVGFGAITGGQAAITLRTAESAGAVPGHAIGVFVTFLAIFQVSRTFPVAMCGLLTLFIGLAFCGTTRGLLYCLARAE